MSEDKKIDHLLPDRHPQKDLFICDVADAVLKDIMPEMEHPFYSLSKKPETKVRRYEHNGNWIEITPSVKGLATIYDKDILIYAISQLLHSIKKGEKVSNRIRINSHELLKFINRGTSGKDYKALTEAIDRLAGTRIKTNIVTGDEEQEDNFGLIDASSIKRKNGLDGRLLWCDIKLSDWVFNAIRSKEVLTLHPEYFQLRKPLERRVYELARKHCGNQKSWSISLKLLLKKSGSQSPMKRFKQMMKDIEKHNHLPDYSIEINENDLVTFYSKNKVEVITPSKKQLFIKPQTIENAKKVVRSAGLDVYSLENEWLQWWHNSGEPELKSPDGAFVNFCKKKVETL